jgi:hypothetical protein
MLHALVFFILFSIALSEIVSVTPTSLGTWQGFGVSLAWAGNVFGGRADIADALFTTNKSVTLLEGFSIPGLGLQLARYNVGGSARLSDPPINLQGYSKKEKMIWSPNMPVWKAIEAFWLNPNSTDPTSSSWDFSRDANQRAALTEAISRGASAQIFSNSPPWFLTANLNPSGADSGQNDNILPVSYQSHAIYMATVTAEFSSRFGIKFESVEAFNEPSGTWWNSKGTQEGCHIGPSAQSSILPLLRSEMNSLGLSNIPIASSDESLVDQAVDTWKQLTQVAKNSFDILQVHGYEGNAGNRTGLYELGVIQGKKILRNSEHGEGDGSGESLATQFLLDSTQMHILSWAYWQAFDISGWGLLTADMTRAIVQGISTKYYILAGLARHIRRDMQIISTSGAGNIIAAYDSLSSIQTVVIWVVFNNTQTSSSLTFDLSSFTTCKNLPVIRYVTDFNGKGDLYKEYTDTTMTESTFSVNVMTGSTQTLIIEGCKA